MRVTGDVQLDAAGDAPFTAAGAVRLSGSQILGDLRVTSARIGGTTTPYGYSLLGDHLRVTGDVLIVGPRTPADRWARTTTLVGAIRLSDAHLGGLRLSGARVAGCDGGANALVLHGTVVDGRILLGGDVRLAGAIGMGETSTTRLDCIDVRVRGDSHGGVGISAENLAARGSVEFVGVTIRAGSLRLFGANVASNLRIERCGLFGDDGHGMSLVLDSVRVGGDVSLHSLATSRQLTLRGARIDGALELDFSSRLGGAVLLGGASARVIRDHWPDGDPPRGWLARPWVMPGANRPPARLPGPGVDLVGFDYQVIHAASRQDWGFRLRWLESRPLADAEGTVPAGRFHAQPHGHLAAMYRRHGDSASSRAVRISQQQAIDRDIRERAERRWRARYAGRRFLYLTVGYGYRPWRVAWWSVAVVGVLFLLLASAPAGVMIPSERSLSAAANAQALAPRSPVRDSCPRAYPCLSRVGYAADVFLPIVDLDQENAWRPSGRGTWGWALVTYQWFVIASGWVLTTIVIAAVTGVVRRDEP
jgi:hypothetical protein